MGDSFRARFKIKVGVDGEIKDQEYRDVLVNYDKLRETKLKPAGTFQFKKGSYIYNPKAVIEYDNRGRPIAKFYLGIANQIIEDLDKEPTIPYSDEKGVERRTTVSAHMTNVVFDRGEIKGALQSTMREAQKFDWMTIIIGVVMGCPLGIIIGLVLAQHGL